MKASSRMVEQALVGLLNEVGQMDAEDAFHAGLDRGMADTFAGAEAQDFEDAGIGTMDNGLILRMIDGTEFHITISQAR